MKGRLRGLSDLPSLGGEIKLRKPGGCGAVEKLGFCGSTGSPQIGKGNDINIPTVRPSLSKDRKGLFQQPRCPHVFLTATNLFAQATSIAWALTKFKERS